MVDKNRNEITTFINAELHTIIKAKRTIYREGALRTDTDLGEDLWYWYPSVPITLEYSREVRAEHPRATFGCMGEYVYEIKFTLKNLFF